MGVEEPDYGMNGYDHRCLIWGGCLYLQKAKKQAESVLVEDTGNGPGPPASVFGMTLTRLSLWFEK